MIDINNIKFFILPLLAATFLSFMAVLINQTLQFYNTIISFLSSFIFISAVYKIWKLKRIKVSLIFLLFYYVGLYFNTFMLSSYQTEKTFVDLYFFFVGPLSFSFTLSLFEYKKSYNKLSLKGFINPNKLFLTLLILYIIIKIYISSQVGWVLAIYGTSDYFDENTAFVVPIYSGLSMILQWTLLIISPHVKRRYIYFLVIAIIIFAILHVKRGDLLRIFVFFLFVFILNILPKIKTYSKRIRFKYIFRFGVTITVLLFIFVYTGNIRQSLKGSDSSVLSQNIGIRNAPDYLSWFYGYMPINYEVLRYYFDKPPSNTPSVLLSIIRSPIETSPSSLYNINGFNASTFSTNFIKDFGEYYFIEMILFAIIIGILVVITKKTRFLGGYAFLCTLISFCFFGNYFEIRSMFVSIIISFVLFPFFKPNKKALNMAQI